MVNYVIDQSEYPEPPVPTPISGCASRPIAANRECAGRAGGWHGGPRRFRHSGTRPDGGQPQGCMYGNWTAARKAFTIRKRIRFCALTNYSGECTTLVHTTLGTPYHGGVMMPERVPCIPWHDLFFLYSSDRIRSLLRFQLNVHHDGTVVTAVAFANNLYI